MVSRIGIKTLTNHPLTSTTPTIRSIHARAISLKKPFSPTTPHHHPIFSQPLKKKLQTSYQTTQQKLLQHFHSTRQKILKKLGPNEKLASRHAFTLWTLAAAPMTIPLLAAESIGAWKRRDAKRMWEEGVEDRIRLEESERLEQMCGLDEVEI